MDHRKLRRKLAGVVAIPVTPFAENGQIDEAAYRRVLTGMLDNGITVVTPNGNTGEFYALDTSETRRIVDLTMENARPDTVVVAGVGGSVPSAVEAALYARAAGAHAIMVHQPVHPFMSRQGWVDYHVEIAAAVPELGVLSYVRNPAIRGKDIGLLARKAPNFIAVKYAVPDPVRFASAKLESGVDLVWIAGLAESAAPGYFAYGATGFTSGLVNVAPHLSLGMLQALREGDTNTAMEIWDKIQPFEELRANESSENNVSVVKEALAQLGVCRRDVRAPISTLTHEGRDRVAAILADWDSASADKAIA